MKSLKLFVFVWMIFYSGRKRARNRNSVWFFHRRSMHDRYTWQILIGVKQYGGHSLGTRLSFGIECIKALSAGLRINDNQACDS